LAVLRHQDLRDPGLEAGGFAGAAGRVHVVPAGCGRAFGGGGIERVGDDLGELFEPGGQRGKRDGELVDACGVGAPSEGVVLAA
jgi:hypothetical protein